MKIQIHRSTASRQRGSNLIECMVYLVVFVILVGIGMGAFYMCWNQSRALLSATNDIGTVLRAGERWRADVRNATGTMTVETNVSGTVMRIPQNGREIIYRFSAGELRRRIGSGGPEELVLSRVTSSEMKNDTRGGVAAWRWDVGLVRPKKAIHPALLFTFEAVQPRS